MIQRRFEQFHRDNPRVYQALVRLARDAVKRGHRKIGIGMLWEVLRWETWLPTDDESSAFKLCNSYRSRYARLIMKQESDLSGIFVLRSLRS